MKTVLPTLAAMATLAAFGGAGAALTLATYGAGWGTPEQPLLSALGVVALHVWAVVGYVVCGECLIEDVVKSAVISACGTVTLLSFPLLGLAAVSSAVMALAANSTAKWASR